MERDLDNPSCPAMLWLIPMKTLPVSLLTLVIGLALGFLATRTLDSSRGPRAEKAAADQSEASAALRPDGPPGAKTKRGTQVNGGEGGGVSGRLEDLLALTSAYHGASPTAGFVMAVEKLRAGEIMGMLDELQALRGRDNRYHRVRNALYEQWAREDPAAAWAAARIQTRHCSWYP